MHEATLNRDSGNLDSGATGTTLRTLLSALTASLVMAAALPGGASAAETLVNQFDASSPSSTTSQDFEPEFDTSDSLTVDDFQVPAGQTWRLDSALVRGVNNGVGSTSTVNVTIFRDAAGTPGTTLFSAPVTATGYPDFNIPLTTTPTLQPGTYWLGIQAVMNGINTDPGMRRQWFWRDSDVGSFGNPAMFRNPGGAIVGSTCTSFGVRSECLPDHPAHDQSFFLFGTRAAIPPPDTTAPRTLITRRPAAQVRLSGLKKTVAVRVKFRSNESGSTFSCKVDSARFRRCASPFTVRLRRGKHTIRIRATDASGNTDATPAVVTVKVLGPRRG